MDTIKKLSDYALLIGSDIKFMGVPKTIDNDSVATDVLLVLVVRRQAYCSLERGLS